MTMIIICYLDDYCWLGFDSFFDSLQTEAVTVTAEIFSDGQILGVVTSNVPTRFWNTPKTWVWRGLAQGLLWRARTSIFKQIDLAKLRHHSTGWAPA
jgi:hypothetical protein